MQVTNLTGERFWGQDSQLPPQVQIAVNINIVGLDMKNASTADAPFVFTVNYSPSIAQLSVKGRAQVIGEEGEISKMIDDHKQNKPPPVAIIQAVSSIAMAEAILLSKSLGIPRHSLLWAFRQNKCKRSNSKVREGPRRATQPNSDLGLLEPSKILEDVDISKKLDS